MEAHKVPDQETRGFKESTGETVSQRKKEQAHDYRYFPEPDIPPFRFSSAQIDRWRSQLPELPQATRARLIAMGIPESSASVIVSSSLRLSVFDRLSKDHDPAVVAKAVANCPEEKLSTLSLSVPQTSIDESQVRQAAQRVVAANPKAVADIKAGKDQVKFFLIGQIKKEVGNVDIGHLTAVLQDLLK
jgi:aspartyl-tRNA(Asn)/glutamyl-tRNA(Gln) amidotransferase subunit B